MNTGDSVKLREDVLRRHARSVPACMRYTAHVAGLLCGKLGWTNRTEKMVVVDIEDDTTKGYLFAFQNDVRRVDILGNAVQDIRRID